VDFNTAAIGSATVVFGLAGAWPDGTVTWAQWIAANGGAWPSSGAVVDRLARKSIRGTVFSTEFVNQSTSSDWSVHRVSRHLRETRGASVR
jgi:hypothetical protein